MNKQTFISIVALLAAPTLLIGGLRGINVFSSSPEPATQAEPQAAPLADASADAPADVTLWVQNPKMDQAVNDGNWFNTGGGWATAYTGWNFRICNLPAANKGEAATSTMVERYVGGGLPQGDAIYQDLTNLPDGSYRLRAAALADQGDNPQIVLFAGNGETQVAGGSTMHYYEVEGEATDNTLRVGLRG